MAAKLTGWKIDIISATEYEKEKLEREQEIKAALAEESAAQEEADAGVASAIEESTEVPSEGQAGGEESEPTSTDDSQPASTDESQP